MLFRSNLNSLVIEDLSIDQSLWTFSKKSKVKAGPSIDSRKLICFHFHGLKIYENRIKTDIFRYGRDLPSKKILKFIYKPYIDSLHINKKTMEVKLEKLNLKITQLLEFRKYPLWQKKI